MGGKGREQRGFQAFRGRGGRFGIQPQHLLVAADHAHLGGGWTGFVRKYPRKIGSGRLQGAAHLACSFVLPDQGNQRDGKSESQKIHGDVASAASHEGLAQAAHHRHRCFRRNAIYAAPDVLVEHEITHHQHATALEAGADGFEDALRGTEDGGLGAFRNGHRWLRRECAPAECGIPGCGRWSGMKCRERCRSIGKACRRSCR